MIAISNKLNESLFQIETVCSNEALSQPWVELDQGAFIFNGADVSFAIEVVGVLQDAVSGKNLLWLS